MLDRVPKYTSGRSINKLEEKDQNSKIQALNKIRRLKNLPKIFNRYFSYISSKERSFKTKAFYFT